jgi:Asp-tRNA(Asn)/Glu-tRNA(Gln) amidotransferase A subunit family amidase
MSTGGPPPVYGGTEGGLLAREPEIQALVPEPGRRERLAREAEELAARWPDPEGRPALYGVLVGVKDIFHVDGFETRAGSRLPPEELKGAEGPAVHALKRAGALILGKTVSTEFAYFGPGPTRNPCNPEHTPGGSSSGSAAAVAAGFCPLALGTQTIGSIIRPAAFCGVVGFKPSYGRVSNDGVIPLAPSFDHVGLFAPDVLTAERGAAALLAPWRSAYPGGRPRLGIPEGPYLETARGEGLDHFRALCRKLADAGYEVVPVPALADFAEVAERQRRAVAAEAARVHRDWYARYGSLYHPQTVELIERGQHVSDEQLADDLAQRAVLRAELAALMDGHAIDLWISPPALGAAPRGLGSTGDPVMNIPWTQAGMPALCVQAGRNGQGLPLGLQVAGRLGRDEKLLAWGRGIAEAAGG